MTNKVYEVMVEKKINSRNPKVMEKELHYNVVIQL